VESIAGLTAVDGATVITDQYEVLAFGVKIKRAAGSASVEQMVLTNPLSGIRPLWFLRCSTAARATCRPRSSYMISAMRWRWWLTGRTLHYFAWSPCEEMVHAHRVDVLLL